MEKELQDWLLYGTCLHTVKCLSKSPQVSSVCTHTQIHTQFLRAKGNAGSSMAGMRKELRSPEAGNRIAKQGPQDGLLQHRVSPPALFWPCCGRVNKRDSDSR